MSEHGDGPIQGFRLAYPGLGSIRYELDTLDIDAALDGAGLVIVHEWNDHGLVQRIGAHRHISGSYKLLFHDTHHRSVTDRQGIAAYDLKHYDGVLAYGSVIRDIYLRENWARRAWTWHEAADTRIFRPLKGDFDYSPEGDLVWIGNWGDGERTAELNEFLIEPVRELGIRTRVHGVRYPDKALEELSRAGIEYCGRLPNYEVPRVFARFRVTLHIPRRPYVKTLPGIPTIRPFEALACGIPLICSPWDDVEGLFTEGKDYLVAQDGKEMKQHLRALLNDDDLAGELSAHGLGTGLTKHPCAHRVDELLAIYKELDSGAKAAASAG
jgi:spore maturation protein CgeB